MNVQASSTCLKNRDAAYHDAITNGVGNHVCEYIPDNFHHDNHKIAYICPVKRENAVILYFQNSISKENMENFNTLNAINPTHKDHSKMSTMEKAHNLWILIVTDG